MGRVLDLHSLYFFSMTSFGNVTCRLCSSSWSWETCPHANITKAADSNMTSTIAAGAIAWAGRNWRLFLLCQGSHGLSPQPLTQLSNARFLLLRLTECKQNWMNQWNPRWQVRCLDEPTSAKVSIPSALLMVTAAPQTSHI